MVALAVGLPASKVNGCEQATGSRASLIHIHLGNSYLDQTRFFPITSHSRLTQSYPDSSIVASLMRNGIRAIKSIGQIRIPAV